MFKIKYKKGLKGFKNFYSKIKKRSIKIIITKNNSINKDNKIKKKQGNKHLKDATSRAGGSSFISHCYKRISNQNRRYITGSNWIDSDKGRRAKITELLYIKLLNVLKRTAGSSSLKSFSIIINKKEWMGCIHPELA